MVTFSYDELEFLFMTVIKNSGQDPLNAWVNTRDWYPKLIVNGRYVEAIGSNDGESINLTFYNQYDDPELVELWDRQSTIEPCNNLIVALMGRIG